MNTKRLLCALATLVVSTTFSAEAIAAPLVAQAPSATAATPMGNARISGVILDQQSSLPLPNATVSLLRNGTVVSTTRTDQNGVYTFNAIAGGVYRVEASLTGYQATRTDDLLVTDGGAVTAQVALARSSTGIGNQIREIARVTVGAPSGVQSSSTITQQLPATTLQRQGTFRVGDALQQLPAITATNLDSAPGDDLSISIRGLKPTEAQALIDGDPIGPIGVTTGFGGGYNYQLSPSLALSGTQVTYGTGGLANYGVDTVAGTIDFETLNPTTRPTFYAREGIGTQGRRQTALVGTGTAGKLGFVLHYGVDGTYGDFSPQVIPQTGLAIGSGASGNNGIVADLTSANLASNTWLVSGNYLLRTALGKLRYQFSPVTSLSLTGYSATSWDDKTGEGDNDFIAPGYAGYLFDQNAGQTTGCAGVFVATDAAPNGTCLTDRNAFIAQASGPAGGTPIAWQALRNAHYQARLNTTYGRNQLTFSGFSDRFSQIYDRNEAGFFNNYATYGFRFSDSLSSEYNTFSFGYFGYHQRFLAHNYSPKGTGKNTVNTIGSSSVFLRDDFTPNRHFSGFATLWYKVNDFTRTDTVDPRLTLVFKPTTVDVFRVSAGAAQALPSLSIASGNVNFNQTPANINANPNPTAVTSVGTAPNPFILPERSSDLEVSYGRRFKNDSNVQVIAYTQTIRNSIFGAVVPVTALGLQNDPTFVANQAAYLARLGIPGGGTIANLGVTTAANAGSALVRGIDLQGRLRFNPRFYADAGYDVVSSRLFDIPTAAQQSNNSLIPGNQVVGVPPQHASLGLDYTTRSGLEARLDGFYFSNNNPLKRQPYSVLNGNLTYALRNGLTLNLGATNILNSQYDQYGRIGLGLAQPQNAFGSAFTPYDQGAERFGLPQRSIIFWAELRPKG